MSECNHHKMEENYIGWLECEEKNCDFSYPPWAFGDLEDDICRHCGGYYDGGYRCGSCGHIDPLGTGEFFEDEAL